MAADLKSSVAVLVVITTLSCCTAHPREKRQANQFVQETPENFGFSQSPFQPELCVTGEVGFINCTHYFKCGEGGQRTPIICAAGTVANPNGFDDFSICAWPDQVPQCQGAQQGRTEVDPRLQEACSIPPPGTEPGQAYLVPHPIYCNAYLTCGRGQVFLACGFCGQGLVFYPELGCQSGGQANCPPNLYVVSHELITNTTLYDESCRMPGGPGEPQTFPPLRPSQFPPGQGQVTQGQGQFTQGQGQFVRGQGQGQFVPPTQLGPFNPPGRTNPLGPFGGQNPFNQQQVRPQNQGPGGYFRRY